MKTRVSFIFIVVLLIWLLPKVEAVNPPPDGGYPGLNTAEGQNALLSLTSGVYNTAVGFSSLKSNTIGNANTAIGVNALTLNTTGIYNTANGVNALYSNATGEQNTANGIYTLFHNTLGSVNTANGAFALFNNTGGGANTATGLNALFSNTTGQQNTATGVNALSGNTTGDDNTATGTAALASNTIGGLNTADGFFALFGNTTGSSNTAIGYQALLGNGNGTENTAVGAYALGSNGNGNTALGFFAGAALSTGDNNIDIGHNVFGVGGESNTIRIGNTDITDTFISGISETTVASGAAVLVDSDGHLSTVTSSKRFKEDIKPMAKASEALFAFKPVTFRYKKEIDPAGTSQFGLIAEEVAKVNPDLVVRNKDGKIYSVRYDQVDVMLLNEFLKEHRKNEEQEATIARQQKQIDALTVGLQRLSAQLEASNPTKQLAANNH